MARKKQWTFDDFVERYGTEVTFCPESVAAMAYVEEWLGGQKFRWVQNVCEIVPGSETVMADGHTHYVIRSVIDGQIGEIFSYSQVHKQDYREKIE